MVRASVLAPTVGFLQDLLTSSQVFKSFSLADDGDPVFVNQNLGDAWAGVVVRGKGKTVSSGVHDRQVVSLLDGRQFTVAGEEVSRFTDGTHDVCGNLTLLLLKYAHFMIGLIEGGPYQVVHGPVDHHKLFPVVDLVIENLTQQHPCVPHDGTSGFKKNPVAIMLFLKETRITTEIGWRFVFVGNPYAATDVQVFHWKPFAFEVGRHLFQPEERIEKRLNIQDL